MKSTETAEKLTTQEAEDLLYSLMLWAFTTAVPSTCRILLGRYVNKINMTSDDALAIRDAFNFYLDELSNSDVEIDVMAVAEYAKTLGCNDQYVDGMVAEAPIFFSDEVATAIEVLTGYKPEIPDIDEWEERQAIRKFG